MSESQPQFIVRYWGVRGSIPTPGPETVRYGGNTTCIEIRCDDLILMIDTGTGARRLGNLLLREAAGKKIHVALIYSHLHLDHIQGFPFFGPIYAPLTKLDIYSAKPAEMTTQMVLESQMAYPSFPIGLANLPAILNFETVQRTGSIQFGDVKVETCEVNHPGGSMAIRVNHRGHSFIQCSDVEHISPEPDEKLVAFSQDADYLSFDTTYVDGTEYDQHRGWGHSTWQHGVKVANAAEIKNFIAFHHDPSHDDEFMDKVAADLAIARPGSLVAKEGMTLDLLSGEVSYATSSLS
jgi:phosphoribosyl 1,2-cyclic phosphodiesterase